MNEHYKKLIALLAVLTDERDWTALVMQALADNSTPYAKSRVQGWRFSPGHKNYRAMTADEFYDVLNALQVKFENENETGTD